MVENVGRIFLALPLSDETRHRIAATLQETGLEIPGRPVPPQNWHLTLRFLGRIDEVAYDRLRAALDETEFGGPVDVRFGRLGAFPRPQRATVLWIGVERGFEELAQVAGRVEEAAEKAGFPAESRPFRAHLTLARIRPPTSVERLVTGTPSMGVPERVERVVVYRSHLRRGGARYEEMESFRL
jgi:2'-5' RNA ligase